MPDPVPLTLYANGIVMFSGPFRPYAEPTTQQCMQDILDGYFPTELQNKFPDGIPFAVCIFKKIKMKSVGLLSSNLLSVINLSNLSPSREAARR